MIRERYSTALFLGLSLVIVCAHAWAGLERGCQAYIRGDYSTALKEFEMSANQGDPKGMHALGAMYMIGQVTCPHSLVRSL